MGESVDDEGAATGMGADEFPLGLNLVGADIALVGGNTDLFIDTGELAQLFDVAVHRLVGVIRQGLVVLERGVLVFLQNIPGNLVQFDRDAVRCLDGRDFDVVTLDVAAAEVVDVGVPEAREAAEKEDVPDRIQVSLGFGKFQVPDTGDFLFGKVDDLPLCHLQSRVELLIVQVGVVSPVGRPVQEPAQVAELLLYRGVFDADNINARLVQRASGTRQSHSKKCAGILKSRWKNVYLLPDNTS